MHKAIAEQHPCPLGIDENIDKEADHYGNKKKIDPRFDLQPEY
jgi:hypothetical protein